MTDLLRPGSGFIFMKVGTHAQEELADIIERKRKEISDAGYGLWGYGGNTCHPLRVQPFARDFVRRDGAIYLCMEPMRSHHVAPPARAEQSSVDGVHWEPIPQNINVLGSRYALAIGDLRTEEFEIPLDQTRVAVGTSQGRRGDRYIAGRVDKACLEVVGPLEAQPSPDGTEAEGRIRKIGLVAELVEPYAVLLRS
jgi:hypothetical protein